MITMLKNKKSKLGIAVIAVALIISFVAYDIAWANPGIGDNYAQTADNLAPESLFANIGNSVRVYGKMIENYVERNGTYDLTVEEVMASLDEVNAKGGITSYRIAYAKSKGDARIQLTAGGYTIRYYNPSETMSDAVRGNIVKEITLNKNLSKQLIRINLTAPQKKHGHNKSSLSLVWSSLVFVVAYWSLDTVARLLLFGSGGLFSALFPTEPYTVFSRSLITISIIVIGLFSQKYYNRYRNAMDDLAESQEKYKASFRDAPVAFHRLDSEGKIVEVNKYWLLTMGYITKADIERGRNDVIEWAAGEVIGQSIFDFVVPEQRDNARLRFMMRLLGVEVDKLPLKEGDREYLTKDGRRIKAETHDTILRDKVTGFPIGVQTSFVDLTDQRKAEKNLKESEGRFRSLFESMTSGVVIYEAVDGGNDFIIKDFNPAGERIQKVKKENLIGRRVTEVFPGVREFGFLGMFKRVWETGVPEEYPEMHYMNEREGINGWMDNRIYKLPSGEIVIVFDDVSARKGAEDKLVEERDRLRTFIDNVPDLIYVKDTQHRFLVANKAVALFMTGENKPEKLIGKTDHDFYHTEMADSFKKSEARIMETGEPAIGIEEEVVDVSGNTRWLLTTKVTLRDSSGKVTGIMGIGRDVTAMKERDRELLEKNKMLGDLNKELEKVNAELAKLATTDSLTGLNSRNFYENDFKLLYSAWTRSDHPITFIFIDLDHFKVINDTHGHIAGDAVLKAVGDTIRIEEKKGDTRIIIPGDVPDRPRRDTDFSMRYGGEELLLALYGADTEFANKMAMKIADRIRAVTVVAPNKKGELITIKGLTVSMGIAQYRGSKTTPEPKESLLRRADQALYRAKGTGRNRIVIWSDDLKDIEVPAQSEAGPKADEKPKEDEGPKTGDGTIMQGGVDEKDEEGKEIEKWRAFKRMVQINLTCQNLADAAYNYHVKSDIKQMLKRAGARSIEDMLGSDKEVRVVVTDAVVASCSDFCFGFYSHAPPVKEKLIALIGQEKFDAMFPRPTLVLTTEALSNPNPLVRQEYILHEILCSACGHYQAIFNQQKIFPENYKDGQYTERYGKKYQPEWVDKPEREAHPFKGALGASLRETVNRVMKDPIMREAMHDLQNKLTVAMGFAYRTVGKYAAYMSDEDAQTMRDYFSMITKVDHAAHRYLTENPDKADVLNVLSENLSECVRLTNILKLKLANGKYAVEDANAKKIIQNNISAIIEDSENTIIPTMHSAVNWLGRSMDKVEDIEGFLRSLIRRLSQNEAIALSKISFEPLELGPGIDRLKDVFTYRAILETNIREFVKNVAKYGPVLSVTLEELIANGRSYGFSEEFIRMAQSYAAQDYVRQYPFILKERVDRILGSAEQNHVTDEFVKAAEAYRKPISVKISVFLTDDGEIRVTVKDNGKGVMPKRLPTLFTPGVTEATDKAIGTGFGLASIKDSVESVGGVISATSEVGKGSAFSFTLPVNAPLDVLQRPVLPSSIVVAVSGLRGSGRKVVCRQIAAKLGLRYINMGFIMRILAYQILEEQKRSAEHGQPIDIKEQAQVAALIEKLLFTDKSIDYSVEPLKVGGVDTVAPSPEDGLSLRDRIKMTIDKNEANFNFMSEMSQYPDVKKVINRFIKTMADEIKASGKFNGVILRVDEPSQLKGVLNVVLNAPSYIRASRSKQDISWIETSDALHEKKDFATRHLNVDRVDTSYKGVQDVSKEVLAHILPRIPVSDGLVRAGEKAFKRMVGEIIAGNFANIEGQIGLDIDIESIGKYMGSLERLTGSPEKVRVIITDAIVRSRDEFCFGFYSHASPVRQKLMRLLGEEEFARVFPKPTLVLSKDVLKNPSQALRQCYILHTVLCQTIGHEQAILKERQALFPEQHGDPSVSMLAEVLGEFIKARLEAQAQSTTLTRVRADQIQDNSRDISAVIAELITQAYSLSKSADTLERAYALLIKTLLLIEKLPYRPNKKLLLELMRDMFLDEKLTSQAMLDSDTLLPLINKYIDTGDFDEFQNGLRGLDNALLEMYRDMLSRDIFKQVADLCLMPNATIGGFVQRMLKHNFPNDPDLNRFMGLNVWIDEMVPQLGGEGARISSMKALDDFLSLAEKMLEDEKSIFAAFREKNAVAISNDARASGNVNVIMEELDRMQKRIERLSMFVGPNTNLEDLVDRMAPITTMFDIGLRIPQELHVVGMAPASDSLTKARLGGSVRVRAQVYVPDFMPQKMEKRPGIKNFAERFLRVQIYTNALMPARSLKPSEKWPTINMHFVEIGGEQNHDYIFEGDIPLEYLSEAGPDGRPFEFGFIIRAEIRKEDDSGYGFEWLEQRNRNRTGANPEGDGRIIVLPPERTPKELLDSVHATALPQLQAAIVTPGKKILMSESLFTTEELLALRSAVNKDIVEVVDIKEMQHRATNANTEKDKLACVMTRLEFEKLQKEGLNKNNNRATVVVLEDDLQNVRYLYTEGVIGLASAMMNNDMQKVRAYTDMLFEGKIEDQILERLMKSDQIEFFKLSRIFNFKPIQKMQPEELLKYRKIMEAYLRAA